METNAVTRFIRKVFSRSEPKQMRALPAFVEEELKQNQRQTTTAWFPMSGYWRGGYSGGGGYISDGEKIPNGIIFSGMSPIIDHVTTMKNARDAMHTSPAARAMVSRRVEAVVGDGLRLEPKPVASILGLTDEQADVKAKEIKERFHLWANSKYASLDESMTLYQMQRLAELGAARDGEYFARLNYLRDKKRPHPLAINLIDPAQIQGFPYTDTQGYSWGLDGILRDEYGRETAYRVRVKDSKGKYVYKTIQAMDGARRAFVHGFIPEYAGQTRGFSPYHHAIQEFSQLTNFSIAHIQKAVIQASIIMAQETEAASIAGGNPFNLDGAGPVLPEIENPCSTTLDDERVVPPYSPVNVGLSPGGIGFFNLKPGNKVKSFQDSAPSDNFAPFVEAFLAILFASCNEPYEVVMERFDSNYSASRGALVMFYRFALILRGEHKSDFLSHVYESWFAEEIALGRISAPGWLDPVLRLAWLNADWIGPLMPDIDPQKSIDAARDGIEAHITNIELEAQKLNGSDPARNRQINERILEGASKAPWNTAERVDNKQAVKNTKAAMEGVNGG